MKSLLPILFTFMVLLRLTDGGQCWFYNRQRGACRSSKRNGERNGLFRRPATANNS
ncbi:hypothetical protein [Prevotella histicola]|uniref:hypothetical protein n=1 Tax=Prevotella histicola TaxID=470565 RepID=UPI001C5E425A|nr:hypothetical protein [Prevotella histicola]MBW4774790.1 hypothetical protein [Prevotella histicola]